MSAFQKKSSFNSRFERIVILPAIMVLMILIVLSGCTAIKPYQRIYLDDPEMSFTGSFGKNFEDYLLSIREGSLVAGSKKPAGSCGCN